MVMLIAYSVIDKDRFFQKKNVEKTLRNAPSHTADMSQAMQSMQQLTAALGMNGDFMIARTEEGFKAVIPNPVLFDSGSASLKESVCTVLDGIIKIAKKNDLAIQVEGHTDNIPISTPQYPSNWELSTMRAVHILKYLQTSGEIPSRRLVAVGYAEHHPMASNETPEGRQKNRRIEILFRKAS